MSLSVSPAYKAATKIQACLGEPTSTRTARLSEILKDLARAASAEAAALRIPGGEKWGIPRTSGPRMQTAIPVDMTTILGAAKSRYRVGITSTAVNVEMVSTTYRPSVIKKNKWDIPLTDEEHDACNSPNRLKIYLSAPDERRKMLKALYRRSMMHEVISQSQSLPQQNLHEVVLSIEREGVKCEVSRFVCCDEGDEGVATIMHHAYDHIPHTDESFEAIFRNIVCETLDTVTYRQRVAILIYTLAHRSPYWSGNDIIINNLERAFYIARGLVPNWNSSPYRTALLHTLSEFLELADEPPAIVHECSESGCQVTSSIV